MSRGVKDLRELICVSRLTVRESDDELQFSDDEGRMSSLSMLGQKFEVLSLGSGSDSRQSSANSARTTEPGTPDSGFATNGHMLQNGEGDVHVDKKTSDSKQKKKKKKKAEASSNSISHTDLLTYHQLPKPPPLPPVGSSTSIPSSSSNESIPSEVQKSPLKSATVRRPGGSRGPRVGPPKPQRQNFFDDMLIYLDATMVSEWLQNSNENVQELSAWVHHKDNYVQFAHFWLTEFSDLRKQEIFLLEHSIILDHLDYGFASGMKAGKLKHKDIVEFLSAVFREYPSRVLSSKGPHMFLEYLDILTSERTKSYKTLLADVKCSTRNSHFAQLVLGVRCFALVSVWNAVVNFYRTLKRDCRPATAAIPDMSRLRPSNQRMYLAVRHGYIDVVHYLLLGGKIRTTFKDPHNRTLLFTAVMNNQPRILTFLLYNVRPTPNINEAADTGNTPLHAAAHCGFHEIAEILLKAPEIDKNPKNPQTENATPLHLAVLHGHYKVVEVLLKAGVDASCKMGDLTAAEIAKDFGQDEILSLLESHS